MNFLLDENISPSICSVLIQMGYGARHVKDIGLMAAKDNMIFEFARQTDEVIITHGLDYSRIHAVSGSDKPSVIPIRMEPVSNQMIEAFLRSNLLQIKDELEGGVFVVVESDYMRVRKLPIRK